MANFRLAIIAVIKGNKEEAEKRLADYSKDDYKPDDFEMRFCREKPSLIGLSKKEKTFHCLPSGSENSYLSADQGNKNFVVCEKTGLKHDCADWRISDN